MTYITYEERDPRSDSFWSCSMFQQEYSWNSMRYHAPTDVTKTTSFQSQKLCVYCGRRALPIQHSDFSIAGYTCACKGACDEREMNAREAELIKRHNEALWELRKDFPKPNIKALKEAMISFLKNKRADNLNDLGLTCSKREW